MRTSTQKKAIFVFAIALLSLAALLAMGGPRQTHAVAAATAETGGPPPGEANHWPPPRFRNAEDEPGGPRMPRPPRFEVLDKDGDGVLSLQEAETIPEMNAKRFECLDANGDGYLSRQELPHPPRPLHRGGQQYAERRPRREFGAPRGPNRQGEPQFSERPPRRPERPFGDRRGPDTKGGPDFSERPPRNPEALFDDMDANDDGILSKEEFIRFHDEHRPPQGPRRGPVGRRPVGNDPAPPPRQGR